MRLTSKDKKGNHYSIIRANTVKDIIDFSDKLGQLEDIEEKHGIKSPDDLDKRLKALKITKEKMVNMAQIFNCASVDDYNLWCSCCGSLENKHITQKEFILLTEVLLCRQ